jgi:hypothetical protein
MITSGRLHRQTQEEIARIISVNEYTDISFSDTLSISEVFLKDGIAEGAGISMGWEITYNCLSSSSGDFSPYDPPNGSSYYKTREQALIALAAWLDAKMQLGMEILMGNDSGDEIDTVCPSCNLAFVVDTDGDILDSFPGDRAD